MRKNKTNPTPIVGFEKENLKSILAPFPKSLKKLPLDNCPLIFCNSESEKDLLESLIEENV